MNNSFTYQLATKEEIPQIHNLISRVFDTFVATGYSEEGVKEFYKYIDIATISSRLTNNHFMIICKDESDIIGIIEMRNNDHVSMLFVDQQYQGQGIAKTLFQKALAICKSERPELKEITVNSSPNAVPIYEKLGFTKTNNEQTSNGIRFTPMNFTF